MRERFQAVLFDLDDTLHDDTLTYRRSALSVAEEVGATRQIEPAKLLEAYVAQADAFWQGLDPKTFGKPLAGLRARMWASALASVGIDDESLAVRCAETYDRSRKSHLVLWPGALDLLARLRDYGCKLGLITNGFAETHREKIALLALEEAFDEILIADEVGLLKPDPRIFLLAARRLDVPPEACAMVGDRFERDIAGAAAVGMFTVWMNVRDEPLPPGADSADVVVSSIDAVARALHLPDPA